MLSIVVPPDFDPEATSSDMMVGEGGQVNVFFIIRYLCVITLLYNFNINYTEERSLITSKKNNTFLLKYTTLISNECCFRSTINFRLNFQVFIRMRE